MRQAVQADAVAALDDAAQQFGVALRLIGETEPCGLGTQIGEQFQNPFRGLRQTAGIAVQGPGLIVGRTAKLKPVLPVNGERQGIHV